MARTFETPLVTAPQENPSSIENYLRVTALLYLFIGLFIFARRWNAPRAIHFYIFCLVSFVLYSFHYSGKLNSFDWMIYWGNVVALLLQPALLVHFALVFPGAPRQRCGRSWLAVYSVPAGSVDAAHLRRHRHARFPAVDRHALLARQGRASYIWGFISSLAAVIFLAQLSPRAQRHSAAAIEVGHGRNFRRHRCRSCFCYIVPYVFGVGPAAVDEALGFLAGADSALLRLRHHSLPPDGRGHHLQARPGLHVCDGAA